LQPTKHPSARSDHATCYDRARGRTILFGGEVNGFPTSETWELTGSIWVMANPALVPPARGLHALAYDEARQRTVLFGGSQTFPSSQTLGDTWEWDGVTWVQRSPALAPSPRFAHAMTYDPVRRRVLLFGGFDVAGASNETWEWDGTSWTLRAPPAVPSGRAYHGLAYDSARARVVLFGGYNGSGIADTWEWDGGTWLARVTSVLPSARCCYSFAHDESRRRTVLYGGSLDLSGSGLSDTWDWDGAAWLPRPTAIAPSPQRFGAMVYDPTRQACLLFGGRDGTGLRFDETWTCVPVNPATVLPFASGCAGSAGTPALAGSATSLPWVGEGCTLVATKLPPANAAGLVVGASTVGIDLGSIGMPGCYLFARADLILPGVSALGIASWQLQVPNDPGLVGASCYAQAFVLDPPANLLGVTVSQPSVVRIGAK
jgi:hypothetical protein